MNKQQRQYAQAKADCEALEAAKAKIEHDYIVSADITNSDGAIPKRLWQIDDEKAFEAACVATEAAVEELHEDEARNILRKAEDALIEYGLSIVPAGIRDTLRPHVLGRTSRYSTRKEIIDATFRLDTRTAPNA